MKRKPSILFAMGAAALLPLTACGNTGESADSDTAQASSGELTEITVGIIPIAHASIVPYGVEHGIFEEHGLDVNLEIGQGGAAMLPALQNEQIDFVIGNAATVIQAVDQGMDMRVVAGFANSLEEGYDVNGVLVRSGEGIDTWADLEDKTVAVNALRGQGDLTIMESVEADGGDPAAVDFVEVNFPDMQPQLEVGNVDAIWAPEPFQRTAEETDGIDMLGHPNQIIPGLPTVVSFSTGKNVEANPETIEKYQAAMADLVEQYVNDDGGPTQAVMDFMDVSEEVAETTLFLDEYDSTIRTEQLTQLADIMAKYGFIEESPITEEFFVE